MIETLSLVKLLDANLVNLKVATKRFVSLEEKRN